MIPIIKELILDAQRDPLFYGTTRELHVSSVPQKATIVIGVRRCGKTTYLNQLIRKFLSDGIPRENFLFLNLFDDRLAPQGLHLSG